MSCRTAVAQRLSDFVQNGGVLLADCRTGVKDETNLCHERTLPGLLSEPLGITIEEYEALAPETWSMPSPAREPVPGTSRASHYADWVTPARRRSAGRLSSRGT